MDDLGVADELERDESHRPADAGSGDGVRGGVDRGGREAPEGADHGESGRDGLGVGEVERGAGDAIAAHVGDRRLDGVRVLPRQHDVVPARCVMTNDLEADCACATDDDDRSAVRTVACHQMPSFSKRSQCGTQRYACRAGGCGACVSIQRTRPDPSFQNPWTLPTPANTTSPARSVYGSPSSSAETSPSRNTYASSKGWSCACAA